LYSASKKGIEFSVYSEDGEEAIKFGMEESDSQLVLSELQVEPSGDVLLLNIKQCFPST
jgi:hypothetical protein